MEKLWTCQSYMPYQSDIRWPSRESAQKLLSFIPLERNIKRENRRVKRGETTRRKTGLRVSSSSNSQMWKEKYERKIKIKATVVERGGVVWTGRLYSKTYIHVHIQRKRRNTKKNNISMSSSSSFAALPAFLVSSAFVPYSPPVLYVSAHHQSACLISWLPCATEAKANSLTVCKGTYNELSVFLPSSNAKKMSKWTLEKYIGERDRKREEGHLKLWNRNNPTPPSLCSVSPLLHLRTHIPLKSFLFILLPIYTHTFRGLLLTTMMPLFGRVCSLWSGPMTLTCQKSGGVKTRVASVVLVCDSLKTE
jgi:hypothetical protein